MPQSIRVPIKSTASRSDIRISQAAVSAGFMGIHCPICDSVDLGHYEHCLSHCFDCKHTFPSDLKVSAVYDAKYAHQYDSRPHNEMSALRWNFIQQSLNLPTGSRILDVGYGNGSFLRQCHSHGAEIFGIDIHGEDFGVPEIGFDTGMDFDLICFFDSLEHFPGFDEVLRLKTRNVLVSVPDLPDFIFVDPWSWRHFKPGEHLHYFSHESLASLMGRWGNLKRIAEGNPEDEIRGKLAHSSRMYNNIYTSIFTNREAA